MVWPVTSGSDSSRLRTALPASPAASPSAPPAPRLRLRLRLASALAASPPACASGYMSAEITVSTVAAGPVATGWWAAGVPDREVRP